MIRTEKQLKASLTTLKSLIDESIDRIEADCFDYNRDTIMIASSFDSVLDCLEDLTVCKKHVTLN